MKEKKTMHIISHSHWDREWYMPFEKHRARLIELVDDMLEVLDTNPNFKSFHFDGQIVPLEDYLEVRPQMREKLLHYISEGRIFVGPWYVLQDEYLISSEANVRNMLVGLRESRKYGSPLMVGYFPDSFGNISQSPQILKGFGIDSCAFGRGVKPVAADNQVVEDGVEQKSSEFIWKSPDGSEVIAVLFAKWYHNAMEIPAEHEDAVEYFRKLIADMSTVSGTPHMLGMNGCDHQPVQMDVGDIIESVKADFSDVDIVHSNFKDYMNAIRKYAKNFPLIDGELYGQNTDGYFTLVHTASARIYMKQANHKNQMILEKQAEPLSVIAAAFGDNYRQDLLNHSWRELLKNHAHDSICGCSVDEVHRECISRFEKSTATAESVRDSAAEYLVSHVQTDEMSGAEKAILVYNPNGFAYSQTVTAYVDLPLEDCTPSENYGIVKIDGSQVACDIEDMGRTFSYVLPRHTFRAPGYYRRLKITFTAKDIPSVGYETFYVKNMNQDSRCGVVLNGMTAENPYIKVTMNEDGTFCLYDKLSGQELEGLGYFEESGDAGDEYTYTAPKQDVICSTRGRKAEITVTAGKTQVQFTVLHRLLVPQYSDTEGRSEKTTELIIKSVITVGEQSRMAEVETTMENHAENHRIRVMFPNGIKTDKVYVDGQYDLLERPINPGEQWVNPDNSQRQQAFVMLRDEIASMVVANRGLEEYEVLRDGSNTVAVTLLRGVWHLGDWGVFPTPEAQCKGTQTASYAVGVTSAQNTEFCKQAYAYATGSMLTYQMKAGQVGDMPGRYSFVGIESESSIISAVKKAEDDDGIIVRFYNPTDVTETVKLSFGVEASKLYLANLNEEEQEELMVAGQSVIMESPKKKITTIKMKF